MQNGREGKEGLISGRHWMMVSSVFCEMNEQKVVSLVLCHMSTHNLLLGAVSLLGREVETGGLMESS